MRERGRVIVAYTYTHPPAYDGIGPVIAAWQRSRTYCFTLLSLLCGCLMYETHTRRLTSRKNRTAILSIVLLGRIEDSHAELFASVVRHPFDLELLSSSERASEQRSMSGRRSSSGEAMRMRRAHTVESSASSLYPSLPPPSLVLLGPIQKLTFRVPIAASSERVPIIHRSRPSTN